MAESGIILPISKNELTDLIRSASREAVQEVLAEQPKMIEISQDTLLNQTQARAVYGYGKTTMCKITDMGLEQKILVASTTFKYSFPKHQWDKAVSYYLSVLQKPRKRA